MRQYRLSGFQPGLSEAGSVLLNINARVVELARHIGFKTRYIRNTVGSNPTPGTSSQRVFGAQYPHTEDTKHSEYSLYALAMILQISLDQLPWFLYKSI